MTQRQIPIDILTAMEQGRKSGCYVFSVMRADADAVHVTQESTEGVNLAKGCGALVKATLGKLDQAAERKFLEEFVKELRS